ncbi:MAG: spermidine synthase [Planctomycetes bacterium]|nr:spermidine synthase [Planctomycetota bacterium]
MAKSIEELDHAITPLGELVLRRRCVASLGGAEIFEVKLDGEFLMSSLVNDAEIALADLALPLVRDRECDVLVGGLGLGYTAKAALDANQVRSVTVIELLEPVVRWHERGLVPLASELKNDSRCRIVLADFFAMFAADAPQPRGIGSQMFHAILLDIDHSPQCLLQPSHAAFYSANGMQSVVQRLHSGGVFALWSADPPDTELLDSMSEVFADVRTHQRSFLNPLLNKEDSNWIVVAQRDHGG